jgi:ribosome-binding protein aMBF1 (putative translation factor)
MSDNNDNSGWTTVVTKKKPTGMKKESTRTCAATGGSSQTTNSVYTNTDHQQWEPTIVRNSNASSNTRTKTGPKVIVPRTNTAEAALMQKLDSNEIVKLKSLSMEARQELVTRRVAKGLNQEKLAQALCIPANLYKDIENGKTNPQQNVLSKINNFLGCRVKLT